MSQGMNSLTTYLQNWKLKLSKSKTVSAAFNLHNREAKRKLSVTTDNNRPLPFCPEPKYLRVALDEYTYRRHLEALRKKLTSRVALLNNLAGSGWGADAETLRTTDLALVHSAAVYCAPSWCCSAHTHQIDVDISTVPCVQ